YANISYSPVLNSDLPRERTLLEIRNQRIPPLHPWSGHLKAYISRSLARGNEIKNLESLLEVETDMKKSAEAKNAELGKELENLCALFLDLQVSNDRLSQQVSTLQAQVIGEEKLKAAFEEFKQYEGIAKGEYPSRILSRCSAIDRGTPVMSDGCHANISKFSFRSEHSTVRPFANNVPPIAIPDQGSSDVGPYKMSRDVITVGSTMRIPLLYRGEYSQWRERFMNYLEEQTDGETAEEKKTRKIDRLARSLLIQGLPNDIYSLIDSNETAKDLWDALERQMCGSEYGEQDRKVAILYEYETFKATEGE
nr:integrase, catalytic region, zinc finger, CCHC-type, peptidase aspartic, catalytic [Tanacetum cinerariifolium]